MEELIRYLESVAKTCGRIIHFGAGLQATARNELVDQLQRICSNVESAYSSVLARLRPVKDHYDDPASLAREIRDFTADKKTRDLFKPAHLCGEVDHLLSRLANNLDPLKYSVDVKKISVLQRNFQLIGDVDGAIYDSYDEFTRDLEDVVTELESADAALAAERRDYVRHLIDDFQDELFGAIATMRQAKDRVLR